MLSFKQRQWLTSSDSATVISVVHLSQINTHLSECASVGGTSCTVRLVLLAHSSQTLPLRSCSVVSMLIGLMTYKIKSEFTTLVVNELAIV